MKVLTGAQVKAVRAANKATLSIYRHGRQLDSIGYRIKRRMVVLDKELHKLNVELLKVVTGRRASLRGKRKR